MGAYEQTRIPACCVLIILAFSCFSPPGAAQDEQTGYSDRGADTCLKCHDEDNEYPVLPIFRTGHGESGDSRSPMAILQCETCHGPAGEHPKRLREGEARPPIRAFGKHAWTPLAEQNAVCLRCHDDTPRINWHGGTHETESVGCADCHQTHSRRDPMTDAKNQIDKCSQCHLKQKAEFNRRSSHPVRFEQLRCSDCHNPHGTFNDKLLNTDSKIDLCLRCHAEKRGPVLWPHAPVLEDCTLCHYAHGSIQAALLKKRPPLLCQQCHANVGHPSTQYSGDGLPGGSNPGQRKFLLGNGCLNCHSQVHGTNHPSGVKLMRYRIGPGHGYQRRPPTIMKKTRNSIPRIAVLVLISGIGYAADEQTVEGVIPANSPFNEVPGIEIDTSRWRCKFCPDPADEPWLLEIEAGLGHVSNDSFKFGEYNGLYEKGLFPILDVDAQYRDDQANYLDVATQDLALDNRRIDIAGGRQGDYRIGLVWDEVYRKQLDTARSPYQGSTSQVLPASWVAASTTSAMTTLDSDLQDIDFSTRRRVLQLTSRIIQNRKWSYDVMVERQTKQGEIPLGAAIGTTFADARAAILAKPVDYITDRLELAANYRDNEMSGTLSFVLSTFNNENDALRWENAFSVGSNEGQLALEPDNQMRQISASGQYRGFENLMLNGSFSYAQYMQDESFLPYTINSVVTTPPLPKSSLDGKVDVARINASALWSVNPQSRVRFFYEYFEHVDNTDRATFSYVIADNALSGTPRANFPYDFRTQKLGAEASRRFEQGNKLAGGLEYGLNDRSYQEVDRSVETRVWARYGKRTSSNVNYSLELETASRDADSYDVLAELIPPENPQLRKYNLADRDSVGASFNVDFSVGERWFVNASLDHSSADYTESTVGLTDSEDTSLGFDLQFMLSDEVSLSGYLNRAVISSNQNGSSAGGDPDWSAANEDSINSLGIGWSYAPAEENFRLGIEYNHSDATGEIDFADAAATPLPDLESDLDSLEVYADFDYSENLSYRVNYTYEVYEEKNWNLDGVVPGTIDNVLNLGEQSPDYKIGVLRVSLRYRFQ